MSDELKQKLTEALDRVWNAGMDYANSDDFKNLSDDAKDALYIRYKGNVVKGVIPQIEQVFKDHGWDAPHNPEGYDRLSKSIEDTKKAFKFLEGKDWYDRFHREFNATYRDNKKDHFVSPDTDWIMTAARRASGIEGEDEL